MANINDSAICEEVPFIKKSLFNLLGLLAYQPKRQRNPFVLEETAEEQQSNPSKPGIAAAVEAAKKIRDQGQAQDIEQAATKESEQSSAHNQNNTEPEQPAQGKQKFKAPRRAEKSGKNKQQEELSGKEHQSFSHGKARTSEQEKPGDGGQADWGEVSPDLDYNKKMLQKIYDLPKNKDFVIRGFYLGLDKPVKAFAIFMEGLTDKNVINMTVLQPLMVLSRLDDQKRHGALVDYIKEQLLPGNQVNTQRKFKEIVDGINFGGTAVFIEGYSEVLVIETKGFEHRTVSTPQSEQVVRGPHEAFTETLRVNTGLIRKALRTNELTTEMFKIGARSNIDVAVMYIRSVANQELVTEVVRRITSIKVDYMQDSGILEQLIEDHPYSPVPQLISTERPDRACYFLTQGRIVIILDGSPYALVVPGTLFEQLHTPEDSYLRPSHGTALRLIRTIAFYIAFLLPGVYLAVILFHQEMIPTELLLAVVGAREKVPFPSLVEVLFMEIAFELIREAGTRIPGVLGATIGIVGALILGQAAVEANVVSPILIIVTAITALASFAVPNYSLQFALRLARFAYVLLGAFLGFFGLAIGLFFHINMMAAQKCFGVPYIVPASPQTKGGKGALLRTFIWKKEPLPDYLQTQVQRAQPEYSRGWVKEDEQGESVRKNRRN